MFLTNFSPQLQKRLSTQNESDIIISLNAVKNKGERVGLLSQWGMGRIYGRKDAGTLGIYEIKRGDMSRMRPCTRYVSFG